MSAVEEADRDTILAALEAVLRATEAVGIYPENTGKGGDYQSPALAFAGGEYGNILRDSDDQPVSAEVLSVIEAALNG